MDRTRDIYKPYCHLILSTEEKVKENPSSNQIQKAFRNCFEGLELHVPSDESIVTHCLDSYSIMLNEPHWDKV